MIQRTRTEAEQAYSAGFYVLAGLLAGETVLVFLPAATLYHQMLGKRLQTLRSATFDQKRIAPLERS